MYEAHCLFFISAKTLKHNNMNNPQPICPHCSSEYDIVENKSYYLYSTDDLEELVCNCCDKSFWLKVHTTYSFETAEDVEDL